jgi:hypothetical protein
MASPLFFFVPFYSHAYSHADGLRFFCRWIKKKLAGKYLGTKNLFDSAVANRQVEKDKKFSATWN